MTEITPPSYPTLTGDAFADSKARTEHFKALTAHFERHPPELGIQPAPQTRAVSAETNAPPRNQGVDAELQMRGPQRPTAQDDSVQRDLNRLIKKRLETPSDRRTTQYNERWEKAFAAVLSRVDNTQIAAEQPQASKVDDAAVSALKDVAPEFQPHIERVLRASDKEGFAPAEAFAPELLSGYTLPKGYTFDAEQIIAGLAAASAAGISQRQIDTYLKSLSEE